MLAHRKKRVPAAGEHNQEIHCNSWGTSGALEAFRQFSLRDSKKGICYFPFLIFHLPFFRQWKMKIGKWQMENFGVT
jgi:hypothetical protein